MIGMVDLSKKGSKIHGIVEKYVAKGNISAGGFVKYFENDIIPNADTKLSENFDYSENNISIINLDENKVFIAYATSMIDTISWRLRGMICTITDTDIIIETDIQLSNLTWSGEYKSAIKISENKIFIAHGGGSGEDNHLYGMICTIDGINITVETDVELSNSAYSGSNIKAIALSENKILITHSYSNNYYLYGMVCTISGTTITTGTDKKLSSIGYGSYGVSLILLSDNRVFISHAYTSEYKLYGLICTISGTTISLGTDTQLSNELRSSLSKAIKISNNKIFIAHAVSSVDFYLYGMICTISETTITVNTDIQLSDVKYSGNVIASIAINENEILITHSYGENKYLYGLICTIGGTTITDTQLLEKTTNSLSTILLSDNNIFIAHNRGNYLYGMICNIVKYVQSATQSDKIYRHSSNKSTRRTSCQGRKTR